MANPKRKQSKRRSANRRAANAFKAPEFAMIRPMAALSARIA